MAKASPKSSTQIKKLAFLVGDWHTSGKILQAGAREATEIRGMDTYEWISGGQFILHRVDVFMGKHRTRLIEIIGYDESKKNYFLQSFDQEGGVTTMHATLRKPGVLELGDHKMKATLTKRRSGSRMTAQWQLKETGKNWKPWMEITLQQ